MISEYRIIEEMVCLMSEFDTYGNENTRVIEGVKTFLVRQRPTEIIDETLKYFGSSLDGAIEEAKSIIGDKYRIPIAIVAKTKMIWFPCKTHRKKKYMWLAHSHIHHMEKNAPAETLIYILSFQ